VKVQPANNVAVIFADPAFERDILRMRSPIASGTETGVAEQYSVKLTPLPNTLAEAEAISTECRKAGLLAKIYADTDATEEQLRAVLEPRILHIATHAQFAGGKQRTSFLTMGTNEAPEAPLLSSVFFLADAGETLKGDDSDPNNDGIVTALEASELDLDGTELVALSACESGRGVIQPGEGVFGLPRAFQSAGAKSILIALWQVPDRETKELMENFYKNWLSGMSKSHALRKAQLNERDIVKKRYGEDIPYYWAAFVLFGAD
jgi:CHAT domain-containing protein